MELLKRSRGLEPIGDRHGNSYYRDWILVYFDVENNSRHQILVNDEARACRNLRELSNCLRLIREMDQEKRQSSKAKLVIWCNKLTAAYWFWKQFGDFEEVYYKKKQAREQSLWCLRNDWVEIRNFDIICNTDNIGKLKESYELESNSEIGTMRAFLKMREEQGMDNWVKLNYSFSFCELNYFYSYIDIKTVPQSHWDMIPNISVYKELQKGIRHGILINHENLEKLWWENCVESWDISSAYPSRLVNMKMPMGKFKRIEKIEPDTLRKLLAAGTYFYGRFNFNTCLKESHCPIFNGLDGEESNGRWFYTLTNFDLKAMELVKMDLGAVDCRCTIIRVAEFQDYIWKPVRKLIYDRWVEKQENKKTNYAKYFRAKTAIDAIWGKSIQEFDPEDNKRIAYRFRKIQNFILPQWGLWACAAIRYDMIRAIQMLEDDEFIAADTDGIKTLGDQSLIFNSLNEEVRKNNAAAGFPSDIGTWHFEGRFDNYIFIKNKFYAYSINDELTCKFAGCSNWEEFFKDYTIKEVFQFLETEDMPVYNEGVCITPSGIYKAKINAEQILGIKKD